MKRSKVLAVILAAVLVFAMTACSNGDSNATPTPGGDKGAIIIGGIGPLTGSAASYGNSVKQGAEIAIEEINAAGGVLGYELKLLFEDDEAGEEKAISAYNKLMDDGMQILMGTVTSDACIAVTELSKEDGILQLTPSGSAKECTQYDNCFRICFTDPMQGVSMADYMIEQGKTKVAIIYQNDSSYSTGIYEAFKDEFIAKGGEVVAEESFVEGTVDFKAQLTKIKTSGADSIFLPFYYSEVAYIADQAKTVGVELPYYGCDGWDGIIEHMKGETANIEGATYLTPFVASSESDAAKSFVEKYETAYNATPDQFAADGYDAIYVIKAAIEKAGSVDNDAIIKAMTEIEVEGLTGTMTFTADGEPNKSVRFARIEDGKYVEIVE